MLDLSVIILAYNESIHIGRAIDSVKDLARDVYVIDSGSNDDTTLIAKNKGAHVLINPFITQAQQLRWALDNAPITTSWVMKLDADELIEKDLAIELKKKLPTVPANVNGINLKLKRIFMGKWLRHGGLYPLHLLRIWRVGHGFVEQRWMDEHIFIDTGNTITMEGGFCDWNLNDLNFFTIKHNKYATREAIEILNQKLSLFPQGVELSLRNTSRQAAAKRWFKRNIYNQIPFPIASTFYFFWRYVFQLGFLDGQRGLIYHFLQGYWYRFLVGAKLWEFEKAIAHLTDRTEILVELSRLTGYKLFSSSKVDNVSE